MMIYGYTERQGAIAIAMSRVMKELDNSDMLYNMVTASVMSILSEEFTRYTIYKMVFGNSQRYNINGKSIVSDKVIKNRLFKCVNSILHNNKESCKCINNIHEYFYCYDHLAKAIWSNMMKHTELKFTVQKALRQQRIRNKIRKYHD